MKLTEIVNKKEFYKIILNNCVVVHYLFPYPILIRYEDAPAVIAHQFTKNLVITNSLDILVCDTSGNFINKFGPACTNPNEFRNKIIPLQTGTKPLPNEIKFAYLDKEYDFLESE